MIVKVPELGIKLEVPAEFDISNKEIAKKVQRILDTSEGMYNEYSFTCHITRPVYDDDAYNEMKLIEEELDRNSMDYARTEEEGWFYNRGQSQRSNVTAY